MPRRGLGINSRKRPNYCVAEMMRSAHEPISGFSLPEQNDMFYANSGHPVGFLVIRLFVESERASLCVTQDFVANERIRFRGNCQKTAGVKGAS